MAFFCGAAIVFWILLIIVFMRDRSRYRNCYLLFFAVIFTIAAMSVVPAELESNFLYIELLILFLALLITPFFLICNGIIMFRRKGTASPIYYPSFLAWSCLSVKLRHLLRS